MPYDIYKVCESCGDGSEVGVICHMYHNNITIIDTIILNIHTNDAYIFDT
jgi:hypothetical protein